VSSPQAHPLASLSRNCPTGDRGARSPSAEWRSLGCGWLLLAAVRCAAGPWAEPASPAAQTSQPDVSGARPAAEAPRLPRVAPDYVGAVIPPNLAPLNLSIQEPGTEYQLSLSGSRGRPLEIRQSRPQVRFPLPEWKRLLAANRGGTLRWDLAARQPAGEWIAYAPFETRVAEEAIDPYVVYRRLQPLYSTYKRLGIYQRHLETFEERPILRNESIGGGCVNCHTPYQGASDRFAMSFRGKFGTPTLLIDGERISRVDKKLGYLAWHPNGKVIAFAANEITQFFHVAGPANRDIFDAHSDLGLLHVEERTIEKPAAIATPDHNENWPCWGPDGRHLYYCSGPKVPFEQVGSLRYDLLRIPYDPDRNEWGKPETLISGSEHRLSAHQPRVSPGGAYLVFTATEFGSFPLFRSDSDLFLLHLDRRAIEPLPINSRHAETWHCWSSNGRWLLFCSRGLDGVFARLLIAHVDAAGRFSKPLLLPQEDPTYYDTCLDNFNAPELALGPIRISEADLARAVLETDTQAAPSGPSRPATYRPPDRRAPSDKPYP